MAKLPRGTDRGGKRRLKLVKALELDSMMDRCYLIIKSNTLQDAILRHQMLTPYLVFEMF